MTKNKSITEWESKFEQLYRKQNQRRLPQEFWPSVLAHLSNVGESIRRTDYRDLLKNCAHVFCWLCGYSTKCHETNSLLFHFNYSLSELVAVKYPGVCGHCVKATCICNAAAMDALKDKAGAYHELMAKWLEPISNGQKKPWTDYSIQDWMNTFDTIYGGRIHLQTMENIGFHLLEEAGEEGRAVRQMVQFAYIKNWSIYGISESYLRKLTSIPSLMEEYFLAIQMLKKITGKASEKEAKHSISTSSKSPDIVRIRLVLAKLDLVIELADTFSWFCSLLIKMKRIVAGLGIGDDLLQSFDLENVIKDEYRLEEKSKLLTCPACKRQKCACWLLPLG